MADAPTTSSQALSQTFQELADSLQVALLLAHGLERALHKTCWTRESAALAEAVARAADACQRLGKQSRRVGFNH